jgi:hypothetical protein
MDIKSTTPNTPDQDQISLDPVHPGTIHAAPAPARTVQTASVAPAATAYQSASATPAAKRTKVATLTDDAHTGATLTDTPPEAAELGYPAVHNHRLIAVGVSSSATPVTIYGWADGQSDVTPMMPLDVQVWARAGRVTMLDSNGQTYRLTLLSKEEAVGHRIGEHWPLGEPSNRAKQMAKATAHDVGHALTFPVWLARTTHLSGARNAAAGEFLRKLAVASPSTVVQRNQTFGTPPTKPNHLRPYDRRGLVGHEGYPGEL